MREGTPDHRRARRHALAFRAAAVMLLVAGVVSSWVTAAGPAAGQFPLSGRASGSAPHGSDAAAGCAQHRLAAPRELRGMWITTVRNIDWPSRPGLPVEQVKAEYRAWLDLAVAMNHNAVFVHVRPSGDALWPSAYAPWSYWLTGRKDGADPGWDPLAFLVAETHARNLEFHAWFNPYKASQDGTLAQLPPNHPLHQHADWAVAYPSTGSGRRLYYNPGIPAARAFVEDSILDAVARYDIDAVHFDDFFYPYPAAGEDFPDAVTYAGYGAGQTSRAAWRRHNVDLLVQEMSRRIKALKPWVKFGISPFGIWRNSSSDAAGSVTRGLESYSAIYADTRRWIQEGWLDYVAPQLYWAIGFAKADYAALLPWWANLVKGTRTQLYIGQADYRVGQAGPWSAADQLARQLALNDAYGVQGSVHFSAVQVRADRLGAVTRYRKAHDAAPALVPRMAQLPGRPPQSPTRVTVRRAGPGTTVTWKPPRTGPRPASYAVYRAGGPHTTAQLVATVRAAGTGEQRWVDSAGAAGPATAYCVTALDRLWNESG
jgi:uncharacterized lipoprotein YddW (UPF0748 family)